jgi:ABC-2 type transport system ATP-binding protein
MDEYAIRTQGLSFHFNEVRAVDNLTLEVPKGIIFGFLGPNGAGKTTTMHLLLGLLKPKLGNAAVLGYDTQESSEKIRECSGVLLEHTGLYERLSAEDNLEFYGRINRVDQRERRDRIKQLLTHFQLWDRRHDLVGKWSRGMKQKLAIARSLLHRPRMLFLDEPTAGLDPVAAAELRKDISTAVEKDGVSVFMNTHNLPEAEKLCARVGVIHNGRLLAVGSPDQLRSGNSVTTRLEISGSGFTNQVVQQVKSLPMVESVMRSNNHLEVILTESKNTSELITLLINEGVQVEEVRKKKDNLEDVFLKIMKEESNVE